MEGASIVATGCEGVCNSWVFKIPCLHWLITQMRWVFIFCAFLFPNCVTNLYWFDTMIYMFSINQNKFYRRIFSFFIKNCREECIFFFFTLSFSSVVLHLFYFLQFVSKWIVHAILNQFVTHAFEHYIYFFDRIFKCFKWSP